jgi:hypothetical protein
MPTLEQQTVESVKNIPTASVEALKSSPKYQEEFIKIASELPPSTSYKLDSLHYGSEEVINTINGIIAQNTPTKEKNIFQKIGSGIGSMGSGIAQFGRKVAFDTKNGIIGRDIISALKGGAESKDTTVDEKSKSNMAELFERSLNFIRDSIKGLEKVDPANLETVQAAINEALDAYLQDQVSYMHRIKQVAIAEMREESLDLSEASIQEYIAQYSTQLLKKTEQPDYRGRTSQLNGLIERKAKQQVVNTLLVGAFVNPLGAGTIITGALAGGIRGVTGAAEKGMKQENLRVRDQKQVEINEIAKAISMEIENGFNLRDQLESIVNKSESKLNQETFEALSYSFNTIIVPRLHLMEPKLRAQFEGIQDLLTEIEISGKLDSKTEANKKIVDFNNNLKGSVGLFQQIDKKEASGEYLKKAKEESKETRKQRYESGALIGAVFGAAFGAGAWSLKNIPEVQIMGNGLNKMFGGDPNTIIETESGFAVTSHSSPETIQKIMEMSGDEELQQVGDMLVATKGGGNIVAEEFVEEVKNQAAKIGLSETLSEIPDYNDMQGIKVLEADRDTWFGDAVVKDGKLYMDGDSVTPMVTADGELLTVVGKTPDGGILVATSDVSPNDLISLQEQGVELWSAEPGAAATPETVGTLTSEQAKKVVESFDESTGMVKFKGLSNWFNRNMNPGEGGTIWDMVKDAGQLNDEQIIEVFKSGAVIGPDGNPLPIDPASEFYTQLPIGYQASLDTSKLPQELKDAILGIAKQVNEKGPGPVGGQIPWKDIVAGTVGGAAVGGLAGGGVGAIRDEEDRGRGFWQGAKVGAKVGAMIGVGAGVIGAGMATAAGATGWGISGVGTAAGLTGAAGGLAVNNARDTNNQPQTPTPQQPQQNNTPPQQPPQAPNLPPTGNFQFDVPAGTNLPPNMIDNVQDSITEIVDLLNNYDHASLVRNDVIGNGISLLEDVHDDLDSRITRGASPQDPNVVLEKQMLLHLNYYLMQLETRFIEHHTNEINGGWSNNYTGARLTNLCQIIKDDYQYTASIINTLFGRNLDNITPLGNTDTVTSINPLQHRTSPITETGLKTNFNQMIAVLGNFNTAVVAQGASPIIT